MGTRPAGRVLRILRKIRILRISKRWLLGGVAAGLGVSAADGSVGSAGHPIPARLTLPAGVAPPVAPGSDAGGVRVPGLPAPIRTAGGVRAGALPTPIPHADGPPLARTGGFGELTCIECHLDLELNAPGGALLLDGVPASFTPGGAYVITVVVEGEGMGSAGFQAAARYREGERTGAPAGRLASLDSRTVVRSEDGVDYINHTVEGSELGPGDVASWSFEWVAPGQPSPVVFHVTGNSANGDNSPLGDLIYTAEVVVPPAG